MDESINVVRPEKFKQVCIWPATVVGDKTQVLLFEQFMLTKFAARVKYLEEIKTSPDLDNEGDKLQDIGGRNDLLFCIHEDDIAKFALLRIEYGIRWIEDVLSVHNSSSRMYPERFRQYMVWDASVSEENIEDIIKQEIEEMLESFSF